jgi:hypothetical protein
LATPQEENSSRGYSTRRYNQTLYKSFSDPKKAYRQRRKEVSQASSSNNPINPTPSIVHTRIVNMGDKPWVTNVYKPLNMTGIRGFPHAMPDKYNKWLPKFSGNNVITVEEHISKFYDVLVSTQSQMKNDDVMKLFSCL